MSPTIAACRALNDLIETARATQADAKKKRRSDIAHRLGVIISQLDATRTRLVQDGTEYIDTAWAYVDSGRVAIRNYRMVVS